MDGLSVVANVVAVVQLTAVCFRERLQNATFLGRYVIGKRFDRKLRNTLQDIEGARKLFEVVLHSDLAVSYGLG
jgi:hypothetical protein